MHDCPMPVLPLDSRHSGRDGTDARRLSFNQKIIRRQPVHQLTATTNLKVEIEPTRPHRLPSPAPVMADIGPVCFTPAGIPHDLPVERIRIGASDGTVIPSVRRQRRWQVATQNIMTQIAILTVLSLIGIGITLSILWRLFIFALKAAFVFVLGYLFIKAMVETIWGLILIAAGLALMLIGYTMKAGNSIYKLIIPVRRRRWAVA